MDMTPPPLPAADAQADLALDAPAPDNKKRSLAPGLKRTRLSYKDQRQVEDALKAWVADGNPLEHADAMVPHLAPLLTLEKGKQLSASHIVTVAETAKIVLPPKNPKAEDDNLHETLARALGKVADLETRVMELQREVHASYSREEARDKVLDQIAALAQSIQ